MEQVAADKRRLNREQWKTLILEIKASISRV